MKREEIANVVAEFIRFGADRLSYYSLHAYVVMANHVHLLVTPLVSSSCFCRRFCGRGMNSSLETICVGTGESTPFFLSRCIFRVHMTPLL